MFLPHFDVICDLLLNRRTATWNLFVLYNNKETKSFLITFTINRKPPPFAHLVEHEAIQNAAILLVAARSKELLLVQENHATVKRDLKVASRE